MPNPISYQTPLGAVLDFGGVESYCFDNPWASLNEHEKSCISITRRDGKWNDGPYALGRLAGRPIDKGQTTARVISTFLNERVFTVDAMERICRSLKRRVGPPMDNTIFKSEEVEEAIVAVRLGQVARCLLGEVRPIQELARLAKDSLLFTGNYPERQGSGVG